MDLPTTVPRADTAERPSMKLQTILMLSILIKCHTLSAQWSSFKAISREIIPEDQRNIDEQTLIKGKIAPKEIRVDWYGFTLVGDTNVIKDRFQYPVADPTLAAGDRIVSVRGKEVTNAAGIQKELRESPDKGTVFVQVVRTIEGEEKSVRLNLHRASSLVLHGILQGRIRARPPLLQSGDEGAWGETGGASATVIAIADTGERILAGRVNEVKLENFIIRGWNTPESSNSLHKNLPKKNWWNGQNRKVGDSFGLPYAGKDKELKLHPQAALIACGTGSSGHPKQDSKNGDGFLYDDSDRFYVDRNRLILGIGKNEVLNVDGKKLEVHVLVNME